MLRTIILANCPQCLEGSVELDSQHSCFLIRTGERKYLRHYLLLHYNSARNCILNFITFQSFLDDLKNILYIQLKKHDHLDSEINRFNTAKIIVSTACSNESILILFNRLWVNHSDPIVTTSTQAPPSSYNQMIPQDHSPSINKVMPPNRTSVDEDGDVSPLHVTDASDHRHQHGQPSNCPVIMLLE